MRDTWLRGWRPYALLVVLCLGLYLPGLAAIPVLDRDEARFAQATRQMLETGDFLHIRFRDEARNNKPAGIYWLQSASVAALSTARSTAIWPYRLPSVVGATLAALLTFVLAATLLGDRTGAMIAAALLASAIATVAEAHIGKTDAVLLAAIVAGQGMLGMAYTRARAGQPAGTAVAAGFWLAEIAATLVKGPIGPGLALITAATLSLADRDWRWLRGLRPLIGLAAMVLAIAPWLFAIEHATQGRFLSQSVGRDFFAKVMGSEESHGAPPLSYLAVAFVTFWPGSLFLAPAVVGGWRRRAEPAPRFLLAWLLPAWGVLELVPTKLPHYVLPLYPALALLAAMALTDGGSRGRSERWVRVGNIGVWLVATLAVAAMPVALPLRFGDGLIPAGVAAATGIAALAVWLLYRRPAPVVTAALLAAMALVLVIPTARTVVPALDQLWLSRAAAELVSIHPPPDNRPLAVIGYREPSFVFLLNNRLREGMADLPVNAGDEALVSGDMAAALNGELARVGLAAEAIDSARGTNYSNGASMTLTLYRIVAK